MDSWPLCGGLVSWKSSAFRVCRCPDEVWEEVPGGKKTGFAISSYVLRSRGLRPPSREVKTPFSVFFPRLSHLGRSETASPRPVNGSLSPHMCTLCRPHDLSCPVSGVQAHPLPFLVPAWLWMTPGQGAPRSPPPAFPRRVWAPCLG